ncbi:MAG: hypothetical protein QM726_01205 [Chitinophagaceae bacterium]
MKKFFITGLLICVCCVFFALKRKEALASIVVPQRFVSATDTSLHFINGDCYYKRQPFSGFIKDMYDNGSTHHLIGYYQGKQEGNTVLYYPDGSVSEKRYYHLGEKDGLHSGWWENGKPRFEYHFANGVYNGDYKEWYKSGLAYKRIHYTNGIDDEGVGWRENGKLFMNFTVKNGRRYGIVNSNLCYTVKNEKGDFIGKEISSETVNSDSTLR